MGLSQNNQQYDRQWDLVDEFYNTNEPEGFGGIITLEEAEALKTYYFIDSNQHDVYEYRSQLNSEMPELVKKAKNAARKIAEIEGLTTAEIDEMFS